MSNQLPHPQFQLLRGTMDACSSGTVSPWIFFLLTLTVGCTGQSTLPELGEVVGVLTIDGRPIPLASIVFRPLAGGRPATALSDKHGKFDLTYLVYPERVKGTRTGENAVFVSTYQGNTGATRKIRPELIPDCYRGTDSALKVFVRPGRNVINLELKTDCE